MIISICVTCSYLRHLLFCICGIIFFVSLTWEAKWLRKTTGIPKASGFYNVLLWHVYLRKSNIDSFNVLSVTVLIGMKCCFLKLWNITNWLLAAQLNVNVSFIFSSYTYYKCSPTNGHVTLNLFFLSFFLFFSAPATFTCESPQHREVVWFLQ